MSLRVRALIVPVAALLLLAGCATHPSLAPQSGEPGGYVVASIGPRLSGPNSCAYESLGILFSHAEGGWGGAVSYQGTLLTGSKIAHEDADAKVTVVAIPLRPGTYRIYSWSLSHVYLDGSSVRLQPQSRFSIPFTVAAGEAVYLGEFLCHATYRPGLLGDPRPDGGYFTRANRAERDHALVRKAHPETARAVFRDADIQAVRPPYIVPHR